MLVWTQYNLLGGIYFCTTNKCRLYLHLCTTADLMRVDHLASSHTHGLAVWFLALHWDQLGYPLESDLGWMTPSSCHGKKLGVWRSHAQLQWYVIHRLSTLHFSLSCLLHSWLLGFQCCWKMCRGWRRMCFPSDHPRTVELWCLARHCL